MRTTIAILLSIYLAACSKGANEGAEEAKKQAEREQAQKAKEGGVAQKISPPVAGRAKLDCNKVIKADLFQQAIGEIETMTVKPSDQEPDAAASCSLIRGGKKLTPDEQKAKLKKEPRLGVLAGDEICNISTFCWTIEDADRFRKKCIDMKETPDESLGFFACVHVNAQGVDDVKSFKFFDDDTKCIIQSRGGPSNVDNDLIAKCAKAAHDLIGPDEIKPGAAPAPAAPEEPAGSAK
jgi:hypothetical protein